MAGHAATPNSETTETVPPSAVNGVRTTQSGSRYGKGGVVAGTGADASELAKVTDTPNAST